jgi:hypothetical protein
LLGLGEQDFDEMDGVQRFDTAAVHDPKGLLPTDNAEKQPVAASPEGPIDWQEPEKWPPDQPNIITAKVVSVQRASRGSTTWLKVTVEDGDEIVLTTFHLGTEPMLNAAIGRVCDIMYAKLEKSNRLLSIKEVEK